MLHLLLFALFVVEWLFARPGDGPTLSIDWAFYQASRSLAVTPVVIVTSIAEALVALTLLIFYLLAGSTGPNCYGRDPRESRDDFSIPAQA